MNIRFAYIPEFYTSKDLSGISGISQIVDMVKGMQSIARTFCHVIVPSTKEFLHWDKGFFPEKMFSEIPVHHDSISFVVHPPHTVETLEYLKKKWCFDFVLNRKYEHSATIAMSMVDAPTRFGIPLLKPVVTMQGETHSDKKLPHLSSDGGMACVLASLLTGPHFVLTESDRRALVDLVKALSPVRRSQVMKRLHVVPAAVDFEKIDSKAEDYAVQRRKRMDAGVVHVFHGGSLEAKRNLGAMVKAVDRVAALCSIRFVVSTQKDTKGICPFDSPNVDYEDCVDRERYLEKLGDGDILWCGSDYEGTGLAYMEAIHSGMIPIFADRTWIRERIPENYPFIVRNLDTLGDVVLHIVKNRKQAEIAASSLHKKLSYWSSESAGEEFYDAMVPHLKEWRSLGFGIIKGQFWFELLNDGLKGAGMPKSVSVDLAHSLMAERSEKKKKLSFVHLHALRMAMFALGYEDSCDSEIPSFVRCK